LARPADTGINLRRLAHVHTSHAPRPSRPEAAQAPGQGSPESGDIAALAELSLAHPDPPAPANAQLADAQLILARSFQATSWPRLVLACEMIDAIWKDDVDRVMRIVTAHPEMNHEQPPPAKATKSSGGDVRHSNLARPGMPVAPALLISN
jgi:hypothetical protein